MLVFGVLEVGRIYLHEQLLFRLLRMGLALQVLGPGVEGIVEHPALLQQLLVVGNVMG